MPVKKSSLDNAEIQRQLADAWLNIELSKEQNDQLCNPLDWPTGYESEPEKYIAWVMTRPEYFSFLCSEILNIHVIPTQALMLKELWNRKFPMLIASRGFGKAECITNPILTNKGWVKMGDITLEHKVYGRDAKQYNIKAIHPQGKKQVCRLTFRDGRSIDCCEDHLWVVLGTGGKEKVVTTKKILEGVSIPNKRGSGGPTYKYRVPTNQPIQYKEKDLKLDPYILGCLLGDGCTTTLTPKIASDDQFIIDEFRSRLVGFELKKDPTNNNYTIVDKNKGSKKYFRGDKKWTSRFNRLTKILQDLKVNVKCNKKFIPSEYKNGSIEQRMELVRGLLDTDGSIATTGAIEFTNTCEQLVDDLVDVLRSLGINCQKAVDDRSGQIMTLPQGTKFERKPYFRVFINTSKPVFKLPRKLQRIKSKSTNAEKYTPIVKAERLDKYVDMQCISVDSPDHTYITKDYIVTHNSFMLSVYAMLRILLMPKRKVVIAGAAFRQSKVIFEYMETIHRNAPLLRDIIGSDVIRRSTDMYTFMCGESTCKAIPIGDGSKIRGQRANDLITDEFASIAKEIFENVLVGYTAVKSHPIQEVQKKAIEKKAKELGVWEEMQEEKSILTQDNQLIVSGTAYYDFNHFAQYWKDWHEIICSRGDEKRLNNYYKRKAMESGNNEADFDNIQKVNWKDYSIIRIPFEMIPKGFMDEDQVARSRATIHAGIYLMEYGACFSTDSNGFFSRKMIENCVASPSNPISFKSDNDVFFEAMLSGDPNKRYIFGVDPASERDNFSIVILELNPEHRRIVYCWTTTRDQHKREVADGLADELDFYSYCAKKIRHLMRRFPCERIMMDSQGGGIAVMEALHDPDKFSEGEQPIWPAIDPKKPADTDVKQGLHIVEMVNFASADWTSEANHGMRKDMEDKILLFPYFDAVTLANATGSDNIKRKTPEGKVMRMYDSLEECVMEIEELKDELSIITITQTSTGRDKWDTPEIKLPGGKKDRLRKDRYSSLIMANMGARAIMRNPAPPGYESIGGWAGNSPFNQEGMYSNEFFNNWAKDFYEEL